MDHHPFLAIWFFVFVIHGACSDGTQKTQQNNPLDKPGDNNGRNQNPVCNSVHNNSAVSNEKNQQLEFDKYLNYTQNSPLPKYPHASGRHKVIKRQDDPPPSQSYIDALREGLAAAAAESRRNVTNYRREWTHHVMMWETISDRLEDERGEEEAILIIQEREALANGADPAVIDANRAMRDHYWNLWTIEDEGRYRLWQTDMIRGYDRVQATARAAAAALNDFNRRFPESIAHSEL